MKETPTTNPMVTRRSDMGLAIVGTRITVYQIMDYLKAGWPPTLIQDWHDLSDAQIKGVIDYIEENREAVEAEYQLVLQQAEENRRYWEERNRERLAQIAAMPPKVGQEELRAKLNEWKARLAAERSLS